MEPCCFNFYVPHLDSVEIYHELNIEYSEEGHNSLDLIETIKYQSQERKDEESISTQYDSEQSFFFAWELIRLSKLFDIGEYIQS